MYTAWNVCKERNRRIFEGRQMDAMQVEQEIKTEMALRRMARGGPELIVSMIMYFLWSLSVFILLCNIHFVRLCMFLLLK
ncbi:hypothetical protein BAE44_0025560 [Dichanthelium oligosanthes]|uniref:Uncharacterized protein n=1 Tax=Dichanthelium oligosanthes TaxID=888268 RepID=A0A1E5UKN1_9POAL|nr:hypothetical protein BAE44_0025560 [Dichanthelium oligosanthes]